ncbi:MAG: GGDEF domain-containing protein [Clostridiales bacterium]|nr:GGDEF domain-containing protein [Clostridiales bacterium]
MKICAFIGDMYRDYSLSVIRTLNERASERGHRIDIYGNCSLPSTNPLHVIGFKSILSLPNLSEYDGIVFCYDTLNHGGMAGELVDKLTSEPDIPPVVCLRSEVAGFYNIVPDNRSMMYDITKYVIGKCRSDKIGFVTGRDDLQDASERRAGFEDAMHEAGYEVSEDMIFHGTYWIDKAPETADFFIGDEGDLPEAIICSNDYMAVALMDELIIRGYSIPEDTMVTGFDNISESEDHIPSLTTLEIPEEYLASTAIDVLEKLHAKEHAEYYITVPGKIVPRESTCDNNGGMDVFKALRELKLAKSNSIDAMREYVILSAIYEGALTADSALQVTLDNLKLVDSVKECYLCRYCENDRELIGYFNEKDDITRCSISFDNSRLLPEGFKEENTGVNILLPLAYKNEVYGYGFFVVDTTRPDFINEKIEFLLMQFGQSINRVELYEKYFGVKDIITLYVRDPLTGIFNRRGFEKNISELFDEDKNKLHDLTIVSIDMDGLKEINDSFGHNKGDEAIKETAACIKRSLKDGEFVARMGGDEFVAVLIMSDLGRVGQFIRNLRNEIRNVNREEKYPFELSASIGTCELTTWNDMIECMNKADKAMYLEKKAKKKNR